jgi:hypothetical protein
MHFGTKNYLKSTRNHTAKHFLKNLQCQHCKNLDSCHKIKTSFEDKKFLYFFNLIYKSILFKFGPAQKSDLELD